MAITELTPLPSFNFWSDRFVFTTCYTLSKKLKAKHHHILTIYPLCDIGAYYEICIKKFVIPWIKFKIVAFMNLIIHFDIF